MMAAAVGMARMAIVGYACAKETFRFGQADVGCPCPDIAGE